MHVAVGLVSARLGVCVVPASIQLLSMPGVAFRPLKERTACAQLAIAYAADTDSPVLTAFRKVAVEVISQGAAGVLKWRNRHARPRIA